MSKVQVDKVVNLSDDGAPQLTYGAELPVGYGLTGAGGLNITGVVTAASAVFSGNVTIGGTLTYEDVTNIDVVGVSTFAGRMNVNSTIDANEGIKVIGVSTLAAVTGTTGTFSSDLSIAQKIVHTGDTDTYIDFGTNSIAFNSGGVLAAQITSDARVGINTNNPQKELEVFDTTAPSIRVNNGSKQADFIVNSTGGLIRTIGSYPLVLNTNQTERLRITSAGDVGIGTNSPASGADLHLHAESTAVRMQFTNSNTGVSDSDGVRLMIDSSNNFEILQREGANIEFFTNNSQRMVLDSDGDLLVGGHSSPLSTYQSSCTRLSVYESTNSGAYLELGAAQNTNGTSAGTILFINDNNADAANNDADGKILSMQRVELVTSDSNAGDDSGGDLVFMTKPEAGSLSERLRIGSDGKTTVGSTAQTSHDFGIVGGANSQLLVKGTEADIWMESTGPSGVWRILGSTGGSTHRFRIYDNTNGKEPFYIDGSSGTNTQHVHVNSGNLVFDAAGTGIDFAATGDGAGTDTSEKLNDYEEGTWTPIFTDDGTSGNTASSYSSQLGWYTKIGNLVNVQLRISNAVFSSFNTSHATYIKGLPYVIQQSSNRLTTGTALLSNCNLDSDTMSVGVLCNSGSGSGNSWFRLFQVKDNTTWGSIVISQWSSGNNEIIANFSYRTDAI